MSAGPFGIIPNVSNRRRTYGGPRPNDLPNAPYIGGRAYGNNLPGPYGSEAPPAPRFDYPTPSFQQSQTDIQNRRNNFSEDLRQNRALTNAASHGTYTPPPAPNIYVGGRSSAPSILPPGAIGPGQGPYGSAPAMKPPAGHVVSEGDNFVKNPAYHEGSPTTRPTLDGGFPNPHPVPEYVKMRGGTHVDYAPGMAPATQPSATEAPMLPSPQEIAHQKNVAFDQGVRPTAPTPVQNQIQLTDQHAREAWRNIQQRYGNDQNAAGDAFHQIMQHYGVDGHALLNQWASNGTIDQFEQHVAPQMGQAPRIPVSMLGPSSGGGSQVTAPNMQATPGPFVSGPAPVTPGYTQPFPGMTPLNTNAPAIAAPVPMQGRTIASQVAMGEAGIQPAQAAAQPAARPKAKRQTAQPAQQAAAPQAQPQAPQANADNGATHFSASTGTYWKQVNGQWQQVQ